MSKPEQEKEQQGEMDFSQDVDNRPSDDEGEEIIDQYRQPVPKSFQAAYIRAVSGNSRKAVIRCGCLQCVGWNAAEVKKCTAPRCIYYKFRLTG